MRTQTKKYILYFSDKLQIQRLSARLFIILHGYNSSLPLLPFVFCCPVWQPQLIYVSCCSGPPMWTSCLHSSLQLWPTLLPWNEKLDVMGQEIITANNSSNTYRARAHRARSVIPRFIFLLIAWRTPPVLDNWKVKTPGSFPDSFVCLS